MNVVLIGFRCAGKSTVGRALAEKLGREFLDCDEYIEQKTHLTIREIFDLAGESYFRSLESQAVEQLSKLDGKVIATGGGAALKRQNMKHLKRGGIVFFLEVGADEAWDRIRQDPKTKSRRPPLTEEQDPKTEIRQQVEFRKPYYQSAADVVVKTDGRSVDEIVGEIVKHLALRGFKEPPEDHTLVKA
jgi:shikimate kinase